MKKLVVFLTLGATPALAHPGHFAPVEGHDHWALYAGIAVIVLAGTLALIKRRG